MGPHMGVDASESQAVAIHQNVFKDVGVSAVSGNSIWRQVFHHV
jgi:hypothetical protein